MKIRIVAVGKNRENLVERDFLKRLSLYAQVEVILVKELSASAGALKGGFLVVLDERGKEFRSEGFADLLKDFDSRGETVIFVIGDAYGVPSEVKESADLLFSLSTMTFTHEMARLFLLEQIYRAFCIIRGKKYHND